MRGTPGAGPACRYRKSCMQVQEEPPVNFCVKDPWLCTDFKMFWCLYKYKMQIPLCKFVNKITMICILMDLQYMEIYGEYITY